MGGLLLALLALHEDAVQVLPGLPVLLLHMHRHLLHILGVRRCAGLISKNS